MLGINLRPLKSGDIVKVNEKVARFRPEITGNKTLVYQEKNSKKLFFDTETELLIVGL